MGIMHAIDGDATLANPLSSRNQADRGSITAQIFSLSDFLVTRA
jgi:hypothetical protein